MNEKLYSPKPPNFLQKQYQQLSKSRYETAESLLSVSTSKWTPALSLLNFSSWPRQIMFSAFCWWYPRAQLFCPTTQALCRLSWCSRGSLSTERNSATQLSKRNLIDLFIMEMLINGIENPFQIQVKEEHFWGMEERCNRVSPDDLQPIVLPWIPAQTFP